MKRKITLVFFLLLLGQLVRANMASPVSEGTMVSAAISSQNIHILSERIRIKIDSNFETAKFIVEYTIQSDLSGNQIPLLFYAQDFKDSFFVWLDNERIDIQHVTAKHYENSPFDSFSASLEKEKDEDEIVIYWSEGAGYVYRLSDLKYFETDIEKGVHKVRVEYIANVWTYVSGWINEFSFRYSLTPAKYWKSFGKLEIIVEQEGQARHYTSNLGEPNEKQIKQINTWTFNNLPAEYVEISFTPKPNTYAAILIAIKPFGITLIASLLMAIIHWIITRRYRRNNIQQRYSLAVMIGSLLVPFLLLLVYVWSQDLIHAVIGENAGRPNRYAALSMFLYPVILPFYWLVFWMIDKQYKKKLYKEEKVPVKDLP